MTNSSKKEQTGRYAADIASAVEADILSGKLQAGDRIDEPALAKRFNVSRTPVREALVELAGKGLIEQRHNRGAFVARISLESMLEVYEILAELEGLAAKLAARRMDAAQRGRLEAIHGRMARLTGASSRSRYMALDDEFHDLITDACRNAVLQEQLRVYRRRIFAVRRASMEAARQMDQSHAEHEALVKAICAGRDDEARWVMSEHVSLRGEQAIDFIAIWKARYPASAGEGALTV